MAYLYDAWEEKRCVPEVEAFYQSHAGLSSLGSRILEWIALCIRPRTEFPNSNHGKTKTDDLQRGLPHNSRVG
jgi:hypothetical protein